MRSLVPRKSIPGAINALCAGDVVTRCQTWRYQHTPRLLKSCRLLLRGESPQPEHAPATGMES